ncbi:glycerol-3-phosphate acyltransferase [Chloroflexota bacterium]
MSMGIIAVVIAYLLGSIPAAYIATRLLTGKDIRQLGAGSVGANNVYRHVGRVAAVAVGLFDVGKGAAAVAIASWLVGVPNLHEIGTDQVFVLAAGLAVVAGHIWPVYLKFRGGNGLTTAIGVLSLLTTRELMIAFAISLLILAISRNPVLSANISLLFMVPISALFFKESWLVFIFILGLMLMLVLHFLPTAKAALAKAKNKEALLADLMRIERSK